MVRIKIEDVEQLKEIIKEALSEFHDEPQPDDGPSPQTRLIVIFPHDYDDDDDKAVFLRFGVRTFISVIERLGVERVKEVKPEIFSDTPLDGYKEVGSCYVKGGVSMRRMKKWLDEIATKLNIELKVAITKDKP